MLCDKIVPFSRLRGILIRNKHRFEITIIYVNHQQSEVHRP